MSDSMVKSAADYEYVTGANVDDEHPHGDLDRIQIDGNIMPVRGDNAVRGEDIAFLMEFGLQRYHMLEDLQLYDEDTGGLKSQGAVNYDIYPDASKVFSRQIEEGNWSDRISGGVRHAMHAITNLMHDTNYEFAHLYSRLYYDATEAHNKFFNLLSYPSVELPSITSGCSLKREDVATYYKLVSLFNRAFTYFPTSSSGYIFRGAGFGGSYIATGETYANYPGMSTWGYETAKVYDTEGNVVSTLEASCVPKTNFPICQVKTNHVMQCKLACLLQLKFSGGANTSYNLSRGYIYVLDMKDQGDGVFISHIEDLPQRLLSVRPEIVSEIYQFTPTLIDQGYGSYWGYYGYAISLFCYPVCLPDWHTLWV